MDRETTAWNFGMLEATLASIHDIADAKRTAFQARLKNFHRLRFPVGFKMQKGKAAIYGAGDIMMMALAMELTQLGLSPEAVTRTLAINWYPTTMALKMSAHALIQSQGGVAVRWDGSEEDYRARNSALPMFLYFDPSALSSLMANYMGRPVQNFERPADTFFYGGIGVVRENIGKWTSSDVSRLSLVNVTSLMGRIADEASNAGQAIYTVEVDRFYRDVETWAETFQEEAFRDHAAHARALLEATLPPNASKADLHREIRAMLRHIDLDGEAITDLLASYSIEEEAKLLPPRATHVDFEGDDNVDPKA